MDEEGYPTFDKLEVARGFFEFLGQPQTSAEDARDRLKEFRKQGRGSRHLLAVVRVEYTWER